jgi:hypothetical protein
MSRKGWIGVGLAAVLVVAWFLFRPERLFVNCTVSEEFPAAAQSGATEVLAGQFKGYKHETEGTATI